MKIEVDWEVCEDHGQCTFAAPDVFAFDDSGRLQVANDVLDSARAMVEEAVDVCPVQALRIVD